MKSNVREAPFLPCYVLISGLSVCLLGCEEQVIKLRQLTPTLKEWLKHCHSLLYKSLTLGFLEGFRVTLRIFFKK